MSKELMTLESLRGKDIEMVLVLRSTATYTHYGILLGKIEDIKK